MRLMTFALMLLVGASAMLASGPNTISGLKVVMQPGSTINPGASKTSSVYSKTGNTVSQSVLLVGVGSGGAPNLQVDVECSYDGTNFYSPTTGASVTSLAANGGNVAPISVPVAPYLRFKVYNTSVSVTATAALTILAQ